MPTFDEYPFIIVLRPLRNPDDLDTFILVPVVESIATRDPKDNSQVRIIQLRNDRGINIEPGRSTHARTVNRKIGTPEDFIEDESNTAVVERIDWIPMRDQKTDSMVFIRRFRNTDEDDTWPAKPLLLQDIRNIAGYRTFREVVRVTADNEPDGSPWVDLELTFMTVVKDPKTDSQTFAYRFNWPEFGDEPINDPDDPYKPYFMSADPDTMQIVDDGEGVDEVVPFRDSPIQNVVNINWDTVAEFEIDELDPHGTGSGYRLADMAIMHQEATAIANFKKFTYSVWFNFPKENPIGELSQTFYRLIEFGGALAGNYTKVSSISIGNNVDELTADMVILVELIGPVIEIDWGGGPITYYGTAYPNLSNQIAGQSIDETRHLASSIVGQIKLKDINPAWETSLETFVDKWHHLAISLDASDVDIEDFAPTILYAWHFEANAVWDEAHGTITPISYDGQLSELGVSPLGGFPTSVFGDAPDDLLIDQRPGNQDYAAFPDANNFPNKRLFVKYIDPLLIIPPGGYVGAAYTSFPTATLQEGDAPFPMHMVLDGKSKMTQQGNELNKALFQYTPTNVGVDDDQNFRLSKGELAVPRQILGSATDVRVRLSKLQVWFDTFVDLSVALNLEKFIKFTPRLPETKPVGTSALIGNPAVLTAAQKQAAIDNNIPIEQIISPASLAFGRPHMYHDGGGSSLDPKTNEWTGFAKNKGKGGKFTVLHDIESYSPAPKNIPKAGT